MGLTIGADNPSPSPLPLEGEGVAASRASCQCNKEKRRLVQQGRNDSMKTVSAQCRHRAVEGKPCLLPCRKLSIHVKPSPAFAQEAAHFVQTMSTPARFVAGDEFHARFITLLYMIFYFQAQPFCSRIELKVGQRGPGGGMPALIQILRVTQDISAVTRTHQLLGSAGDLAGMKTPATTFIGCATAGAGFG